MGGIVSALSSNHEKKLNYFDHELERITAEEKRALAALEARKKRTNLILAYISYFLVFTNITIVVAFSPRFAQTTRKRYSDWSRIEAGLLMIVSVMVSYVFQEGFRLLFRWSHGRRQASLDSLKKRREQMLRDLKELTKVDRITEILRKYETRPAPADPSTLRKRDVAQGQAWPGPGAAGGAAPQPIQGGAVGQAPLPPGTAAAAAAGQGAARSSAGHILGTVARAMVGSTDEIAGETIRVMEEENRALRRELEEKKALLRAHNLLPVPMENDAAPPVSDTAPPAALEGQAEPVAAAASGEKGVEDQAAGSAGTEAAAAAAARPDLESTPEPAEAGEGARVSPSPAKKGGKKRR